MNYFLFVFLTCNYVLCVKPKYDYYWRNFRGEIPCDAVPGGLDKSGNTTYIAQVFHVKLGILPTRIYIGDKSATVSKYDGNKFVHTSGLHIKILCSQHHDKFRWIPANAATLHSTSIGNHLVVGGTENGYLLNIGRLNYQGELIVGKVCGYNIGDAMVYFPYKNDEKKSTTYDVLTYKEPKSDNTR